MTSRHQLTYWLIQICKCHFKKLRILYNAQFSVAPYMTAILHLYMFCMVDGLSLQVRTPIPDKIIPQIGPKIHSTYLQKEKKKKKE